MVLFILKHIIFSKNNKNVISREIIKNKNIKPVIKRKSIDYDNRSTSYIIFGKENSIIIYSSWWEKISVGDSIIKPQGSLELLIKKHHKIEKLNYEEEYLPLLLE